MTPISLVFVIGLLLVVAGYLAENTRTIRAGAGCLLAAVVLMALGMWMQHRGWWD
jgi:hypothetical protein